MGNGQWTMDNGQWTMDNGQWTMDNGQWTMDNGQWTMDNGQWTMKYENPQVNKSVEAMIRNKKSNRSNLTCLLPIAHCLLSIACCLLTISCRHNETVDYQPNDCKRQPAFIRSTGLDPNRSAFSTSEKKVMGLALIQIARPGDTSGQKIYQHPSWKTGGWLGPIQLDAEGNCFVAPIPVINLLNNPPEKQNIIYRVDGATGGMSAFAELPVADSISPENPYGILGLAYLCESNTLYASSVQGSTREKENGMIYAIDASSAKVIDKIAPGDVIGMGISYISGERCLYFGSARTSDIYTITLSSEGKFAGKPSPALSIAGLGPRGDDKVRRIRFDKATGQMQVAGVEFNFNLTAPTEKQESIYKFHWDDENKKWLPDTK